MEKVSEIEVRDMICCTVFTRIDEIQRLMKEQDVHEMPIVDSMLEKHILGVVTEENIKKQSALTGASPSQLTTEQVLNPIPAVYETSAVSDVREQFGSLGIANVPVVDREGRFCGVINLGEQDIQ